ncbi:TPA: hypothetical protein GGA36_004703 [Escherichia coli]|nr:hypothetical protein [Escherichia coli]EFG0721013.1 hypothetical protein [Escherichia coli]EFI6541719.1 hypothetical protein [Escherichia coli]EFM9269243.1 hypothetical protein [Escherichia coli]EFN3302535.1 hypothetical protein [Escherichia coli]HAG5879677.1 hypothetical protein [Escherichia coli]
MTVEGAACFPLPAGFPTRHTPRATPFPLGAMTYRVHTDTEDNPFSGGLFSQFGLSDTLY